LSELRNESTPKEATPSESALSQELPVPEQISWSELITDEKILCLTDLLLTLREKQIAGEASLCLLAPPGAASEIETLWAELINRCIAPPYNAPLLEMPVLVRENLSRPALYTTLDRETGLVTQCFNEKLQASGVDPHSLLPVSPSLPALCSFYLVSEILLNPKSSS